jgi:hypothetical protein
VGCGCIKGGASYCLPLETKLKPFLQPKKDSQTLSVWEFRGDLHVYVVVGASKCVNRDGKK